MAVTQRTKKNITLQALESHFVSFDPVRRKAVLDAGYLNDSIQIFLDNDQRCYDAMVNPKQKPTAAVWKAFKLMTNCYISNMSPDPMHPEIIYYASSSHLKEFLNLYGNGYDTLKESVEYVEQERKRIKEEEANA